MQQNQTHAPSQGVMTTSKGSGGLPPVGKGRGGYMTGLAAFSDDGRGSLSGGLAATPLAPGGQYGGAKAGKKGENAKSTEQAFVKGGKTKESLATAAASGQGIESSFIAGGIAGIAGHHSKVR